MWCAKHGAWYPVGGAVDDTLFNLEDTSDLQAHERNVFRHGFRYPAGVDEAGRGALAGPVVAAAVIFPPGIEIAGVDDSKKVTPSRREALFDLIIEKAVATGIAVGDHDLIDSVNILQATLISMKNAINALSIQPDYLLVDGSFAVPVNIPQKPVVKGDATSISIAAASILAKVTRDRMMIKYDSVYPGYGFADHKGYACASHLAAISINGPCDIHRKTFRGVKEWIPEKSSDLLPGII